MRRILIIDDEEGIRRSLGMILADEGWQVETAANADQALRALDSGPFQIMLCDVRMPGRSGLDLLPALLERQPEALVLMMSAFGDVAQSLAAVRLGAYDYLAKPFQPEELLLTLGKAEERERLRLENRRLRSQLGEQGSRALVAASLGMRQVFELIEQAAEYKTTVLITGESGVGKEVVARTVHARSGRSEQPFIAVNCAAIPDTLIESELFGHARGSFTGADSDKLGLFREADGGTLFLDEVGELPPAVQVKLLRVLQEEEVRPVGEPKAVAVDVRIVAATARELETEVAQGRFREDLYYRLNVFRIQVPPLRERREDIPVLADALLESLARRIGKAVAPLERVVVAKLRAHAWPGNVRELRNTLERAIILARDGRIGPEHLPFADPEDMETSDGDTFAADDDDAPGEAPLSIKRGVRQLEERLIRRALVETAGNRTRAAELLEISPRALQYKIKEYGLAALNPAGAPADTALARPRPGSRR